MNKYIKYEDGTTHYAFRWIGEDYNELVDFFGKDSVRYIFYGFSFDCEVTFKDDRIFNKTLLIPGGYWIIRSVEWKERWAVDIMGPQEFEEKYNLVEPKYNSNDVKEKK